MISSLQISASFLLVVEKETIFNQLLQSYGELPDCVIVTGKGYPDYATKFVKGEYGILLGFLFNFFYLETDISY
jgi:DNA topoisomerase VI subunit A